MISDKHIDLYQLIADAEEPRVFEKWHASSIAECPRAHYFKRLGVPALEETKPSAAKLLRFTAGHLMEEAIRPHVEKLYGEVSSNVRFETDNLTGEMDNYSSDKKRIIEIKSVHDYAFIERDGRVALKEADGVHEDGRWEGKNRWTLKETPYLHHEIQNHVYYGLAVKNGLEVEGIDYVYISLSGRLVVYETDIQQDKLKIVKDRLETLDAAWKAQKPPRCVCLDESSELYGPVYQYCDYRQGDKCCSLELIKEGE